MKITDLVRETAEFVSFQDGKLWYQIGNFQFPVPVSDTGTGVFLKSDRGMYFMRWIRKEIERREEEQKMIAEAKANWNPNVSE